MRLKFIHNLKEITQELEKIGCDKKGIEIMKNKFIFKVVKLNTLDVKAANILKQQSLSIGCECAVSKNAISYNTKTTDVLLCGTLKQYHQLIKKLAYQPFGLKYIAQNLTTILKLTTLKPIQTNKRKFCFGKKTYIIGILNLSPDSFSCNGITEPEVAVKKCKQMIKEGADIIDVGAQSTRPFSDEMEPEKELNMLIPVLKKLSTMSIPVSVDSYKYEVLKNVVKYNISMVNDVTGLRDERIAKLCSIYKLPVIIMHMKGMPKDMQINPYYDDVIEELYGFFENRIKFADKYNLNVIIDPGIGFGKRVEDNITILHNLREFKSLRKPLLIGTSRKSFIGKILNLDVKDRLEGSLATVVISIINSTDFVRVHDVKETKRVVDIVDTIIHL